MTLLKTLVRSLEAPAARRMRLAAEHKARAQQRYAREALAREALGARIQVCPVHVGERGCHDDPGAVVRPFFRQRAEARQPRERDVHPERARPAPVARHPRAEVRVDVRGLDEPAEQDDGKVELGRAQGGSVSLLCRRAGGLSIAGGA